MNKTLIPVFLVHPVDVYVRHGVAAQPARTVFVDFLAISQNSLHDITIFCI